MTSSINKSIKNSTINSDIVIVDDLEKGTNNTTTTLSLSSSASSLPLKRIIIGVFGLSLCGFAAILLTTGTVGTIIFDGGNNNNNNNNNSIGAVAVAATGGNSKFHLDLKPQEEEEQQQQQQQGRHRSLPSIGGGNDVNNVNADGSINNVPNLPQGNNIPVCNRNGCPTTKSPTDNSEEPTPSPIITVTLQPTPQPTFGGNSNCGRNGCVRSSSTVSPPTNVPTNSPTVSPPPTNVPTKSPTNVPTKSPTTPLPKDVYSKWWYGNGWS